jgi:transposase
MAKIRAGYPSDVSDEEWAYAAPYLTLMKEDAPQREYAMRDILNALRYVVRSGAPWRMLPNDLPPWKAVYDQSMRWFKAGCFEAMAHDLRALLRMLAERASTAPTAIAIDSRTLQSTPESGTRAKYDGYKRKKGSKVHIAVDTMGHLLALHVTPADVQDRAVVGEVAAATQVATGQHVQIAWVDQGYTGEATAEAALAHDIKLVVVKLPQAKRGLVMLPRRWVVERSFGWLARCRRLARDCERLASTLAGMHWVAFALLMLRTLYLAHEKVRNTL